VPAKSEEGSGKIVTEVSENSGGEGDEHAPAEPTTEVDVAAGSQPELATGPAEEPTAPVITPAEDAAEAMGPVVVPEDPAEDLAVPVVIPAENAANSTPPVVVPVEGAEESTAPVVAPGEEGVETATEPAEEAAEPVAVPADGGKVASEPADTSEGTASGLPVVVRKELRAMPRVEQERFCAALLRMMEGPGVEEGQSDFFRIAGYHGYPTDYCHHAQETFPSWHRAYLSEFEQALRRADMEVGGDGAIGLPYWDWSREEVNGEALPAIIREKFGSPPEALIKDLGEMGPRFARGYMRREDEELRWRLQQSEVVTLTENCLEESLHWKHASTRWGGRTSVENPHNRIHVAVGWPMSSVEFAAFDPIFWLHHCNLDRVYQRYLSLHGDSAHEMATTQRQLHIEQGEPDRFAEPLLPFKHPTTGKPAMPADSFEPTEAMGFRYDELPPMPAARQRAAPVLALFRDIQIEQIPDGHCYELHVFVSKREQFNTVRSAKAPGHLTDVTVDTDWVPAAAPNDWKDDAGYAGFGAIFSRNKDTCSNCRARGPIMESVDINQALARLGISPYQASLRVAVLNEMQTVLPLNQTSLPSPTIVLPLLEGLHEALGMREGPPEDAVEQGQVLSLQAHLQHLGYDTGATDGWLGPKTSQAIQTLKGDLGLSDQEQGGMLSSAALKAMRAKRMDAHPHRQESQPLLESSNSSDKLWLAIRGSISRKKEVKYWVGTPPGYLPAEEAAAEVEAAFGTWQATGLWAFTRVAERQEADCTVLWDAPKVPTAWFDGSGGTLAVTSTHYIHLDASEHWLLQRDTPLPGRFQLLPVLVHEIGHLLGLGHSNRRDDIMFPFYMEGKVALSANDVEKARGLYPASRPSSDHGS